MTRPEPRKSSLAGNTPIAPPPAPAPAAAQESVEQATPAAAAMPAPKAERKAPAKTGSKYPPKVSFYQDREDTDRVRGALLHTMASEGSRSLSQFIHEAVMAEVERLEAKYNNGQPFPRVPARELPQGRPMGE